MKWMLVVLISGVTPVSTNLVFDKFSECLAAEEQMRQHYADAFDAWDRSAAANADRRRDYRRARDIQARRMLGNIGTCIPHADGNQPQIVTPQQPVTPQTSQPTPQPSPRTWCSQRRCGTLAPTIEAYRGHNGLERQDRCGGLSFGRGSPHRRSSAQRYHWARSVSRYSRCSGAARCRIARVVELGWLLQDKVAILLLCRQARTTLLS